MGRAPVTGARVRIASTLRICNYSVCLCWRPIGARRRGRLLRGSSGRAALRQFQGQLQVVFDLGEGALSKGLEVRAGAILDLISEKRSVAFLIVDLALHIVTVERGARVGLE